MAAQRFAILSVPRSGTNYFISKIVLLPGLLFAWEPFNTDGEQGFEPTDLFNSLPAASRRALTELKPQSRPHEDIYYEVFSPRSTLDLPGVSALGFKLVPNQSPELFWKVAADPGLKVVVLERRNRFHTYASHLMAGAEGEWAHKEFKRKGKLHFDPMAFDIFVEMTDAIYGGLKATLEANHIEYIHLYYEDFTTREDDFVQACKFVGLNYQKISAVFTKQITISPRDLFYNTDDVDRHLLDYPQFINPVQDAGAGLAAPNDDFERNDQEIWRLRALLAERNAELAAREAQIYALRAGLGRMTDFAPIGAAGRTLSAATRLFRRGAKVLYWTATLQLFARLAERRRLQG